MILRSFAVPIFLGLLGGISGIFAGSKGLSLLWPYALMQAGMNANKRIDTLAGHYAAACSGWPPCSYWRGSCWKNGTSKPDQKGPSPQNTLQRGAFCVYQQP